MHVLPDLCLKCHVGAYDRNYDCHLLSRPLLVYFLNPGFEINTVLVSFLITMTEYLRETAKISYGLWFKGHRLPWSGMYNSEWVVLWSWVKLEHLNETADRLGPGKHCPWSPVPAS